MAKAPKRPKRRVVQSSSTGVVRFFRNVGIVCTIAFFAIIVNSMGGTNPFTPPGHEGYIYHQPIAIGQRGFVEAQTGPTSPGWRWRQYVTNIDMRVNTYSETMQIFSADNLEVSFEAHARIRLKEGTVQEIVERYSGDTWYQNNVRRPYRTAVREVVRGYDAFAIKDESEAISDALEARLRSEYEETPFEILSISIGNINYPESVEQRVVANLAAEQRRQRMEVQQQIVAAEAEIREIRARGEAQAQEIEQQTLTPLFVQHEAAELYRTLASEGGEGDGRAAEARVVVVLPTRADRAGVPRIYEGGAQ